MKRSLFTLGLLFTFGACVLHSRTVAAQVTAAPSLLNFQGRLTKPDGTPVSDGTYALRFSLHIAETGGTELWNQTLPTVTVKNGVFAALLNVGSGFQNGATASTLFSNNLFLEIQVGTDTPLTPRQPLVSVAYAMKANTVPDGSITTEKLATGALNNLSWLLSGNNISSPTTQFLGSTNNQPLVFRTNNAERMRLAASGNLGIGTTDPQLNRVQINNTFHFSSGYGLTVTNANFGANVQYNGSGIGLVVDKSDAANGSTVFLARSNVKLTSQNLFTVLDNGNVGIGTSGPTERLTVTNAGATLFAIKNNGNVGIGTLSPTDRLTVFGSGTAISAVDGGVRTRFFSAEGTPAGYAGTSSAHPFILRSSDTDRVFIAANGNIGVGTSVPSTRLDVNGTARFLGNVNIGDANFSTYNGTSLYVDARGQAYGLYVQGPSATSYALYVNGRAAGTDGFLLSSDARYKKNITTCPDALNTILNLRGVTYDWRRDEFKSMGFSEGQKIGFIAQEVEKVLPQLVYTDSKGYKAVNYTNVVPVLVEAMKTQQKQIETQQKQMEAERNQRSAEINALQAQMNALMQRLQELENHQGGK